MFGDCNQTASGNNAGSPKDPENFEFSMEDIPQGTKIKEIRVWSTEDSDPNQSSNKYVVKEEATRYYSIEFTLTPQ